jgi:hypothetical protein
VSIATHFPLLAVQFRGCGPTRPRTGKGRRAPSLGAVGNDLVEITFVLLIARVGVITSRLLGRIGRLLRGTTVAQRGLNLRGLLLQDPYGLVVLCAISPGNSNTNQAIGWPFPRTL